MRLHKTGIPGKSLRRIKWSYADGRRDRPICGIQQERVCGNGEMPGQPMAGGGYSLKFSY